MIASELIKRLSELISEHGDLEVATEGCDCLGDSAGVQFDKYGYGPDRPTFLITRSE